MHWTEPEVIEERKSDFIKEERFVQLQTDSSGLCLTVQSSWCSCIQNGQSNIYSNNSKSEMFHMFIIEHLPTFFW